MDKNSPVFSPMLAGDSFPIYFPYPRFLLSLPLNEIARVIYALILDRARRSAADPYWQEEGGTVFVYYTMEELAKTTGKCPATVKVMLRSLEEQGLLIRKRQGLCKPTKLYPCIPAQAFPRAGSQPSGGTGSQPSGGIGSQPSGEVAPYLYGQVGFYRSVGRISAPNKNNIIKII